MKANYYTIHFECDHKQWVRKAGVTTEEQTQNATILYLQ